jgi:hypothetical protein
MAATAEGMAVGVQGGKVVMVVEEEEEKRGGDGYI